MRDKIEPCLKPLLASKYNEVHQSHVLQTDCQNDKI